MLKINLSKGNRKTYLRFLLKEIIFNIGDEDEVEYHIDRGVQEVVICELEDFISSSIINGIGNNDNFTDLIIIFIFYFDVVTHSRKSILLQPTKGA